MAKVIMKIPAPVDASGRELTVEEIEELGTEPEYVEVLLEINGQEYRFSVACDFDQVSKDADQAYQLLKAREYKIRVDERVKKRRNSKLTNIAPDATADEETEDENILSGEQFQKLIELQPDQRKVFIDLALPSICGHNVPKMPVQESGEDDSGYRRRLRTWFEAGGKTSTTVLEAVVMSYDPTAFLAEERRAARRQKELMATLQKKLEAAMEAVDLETEPPIEELKTAESSETAPLETSTMETETTAMTPNPDFSPPSPAVGAIEPAAASGTSPIVEASSTA